MVSLLMNHGGHRVPDDYMHGLASFGNLKGIFVHSVSTATTPHLKTTHESIIKRVNGIESLSSRNGGRTVHFMRAVRKERPK